MKVINAIVSLFKKLFCNKETKVEVLDILTTNYNSPEMQELKDADLFNKAFEFVKLLHVETSLTVKQKQMIFNDKMSEYLGKIGKVVSTVSLNLLRELAYLALKIALTKGLTLLLANGTRVTPGMKTCAKEPEQLELDLDGSSKQA